MAAPLLRKSFSFRVTTVSLRIPAKSASDSEVKAATIPGKASTRRSEATLGRVIISEVDGFGQTRTAFVV